MALHSPRRASIRDAIAAERGDRTRRGFNHSTVDSSCLARLPTRPNVEQYAEIVRINPNIKENSLESLEHSIGCPKYRAESKSKCHLRSPARQQKKVLHPKPWGARDPKEIPCTCSMRRSMKSAPASNRASPAREIRKSVPRRATSPNGSRLPVGEEEEVMRRFDEFCDQAEKVGVKLTNSKLSTMTSKLKSKLGAEQDKSPSATEARTRAQSKLKQRRTSSIETPRVFESELKAKLDSLDQRSASNQSQHPSVMSHRSPSTMRGKLETNNVVLELSGSDFPEQSAFTNIFGSMLPSDRFGNYIALGGSQFFGPADVLAQSLPASTTTAIVTFDSAESFSPKGPPDVVGPPIRLAPRSPYKSHRRRP